MKKQINESDEKKDLRIKILEKANNMFQRSGIKDVKMNDIATSLGISKRTLYQLFENKEYLLVECIKYKHTKFVEEAKNVIRQSQGTMEIILTLYHLYLNEIKNINKNYFKELNKYPKVIEESQKRTSRNEHKIRAWLESGIKEGIFREDTNFEILLYIIKNNLKFITTTNMFDNYNIKQVSNAFILSYLRGISTPMGQKIIEEYIKKTN